VLGDEVAGDGVDAHAEEGAENKVDEAPEAIKVPDGGVEGYLAGVVYLLPVSRVLGVDEKGAEGVEEGLEEAPDDLESCVGEELCLQR